MEKTMILKRHLERLEEFSNFEDGWHNGECEAPSEIAIKNARRHLHLYSNFEIFPALSGGILIEGDDYHVIFYNDGDIATYNLCE